MGRTCLLPVLSAGHDVHERPIVESSFPLLSEVCSVASQQELYSNLWLGGASKDKLSIYKHVVLGETHATVSFRTLRLAPPHPSEND